MARKTYNTVAYTNIEEFLYGKAKYPVVLKNGLSIGGGKMYPEINFTLPPMLITKDSMPEVIRNYKEVAEGLAERSRHLNVEGYVVELELLGPMTENPEWGAEVVKTVVDVVKENEIKHGIKVAVRSTIADLRDGKNLEHMYRGKQWDAVLKTFEETAKAGAELLAIESLGGKSVHDEGVMFCDISKVIFSLGVLGCTDMEKLWTEVVRIADSTGSIASGDTACGFANTALVLGEKNYIPTVFSAACRVMAAVRSMVAIECGAKGPDKDCGYEGPYLKAITGTPISMEGHVAACAHLTRCGNIAICVADLWSNESIQNIKLLAGMAPIVSFEQLVYSCRLMNGATARGKDAQLLLRDLHADSDSRYDAHSYILRPDVVLEISKELVKTEGDYARTKKAAALALEYIQKGSDKGELFINDKEKQWLNDLQETIAELPKDKNAFMEEVIDELESFEPDKYDF